MSTDYSNTVVYQIKCKDSAVCDSYIGHTTNFHTRQNQHKQCSENPINDVKLYKTIRAHGGWSNWEMVELERFHCQDSKEARMKEQEYYENLKPSLNSVAPFSGVNKQSKQYKCDVCQYMCNRTFNWNKHLTTSKHLIAVNVNTPTKPLFSCACGKTYHHRQGLWLHKTNCDFVEKETINLQSKVHECELCHYVCSRKFNLHKHFATAKHKKMSNGKTLETKTSQSSAHGHDYQCQVCKKSYHNRSGLWKHGRICKQDTSTQEPSPVTAPPFVITEELFLMIVKQNADMMELLKAGTHNTNNNHSHNTNCHNKAFNLNFFLNETCKDAMNITDFVESIKVQLNDLE